MKLLVIVLLLVTACSSKGVKQVNHLQKIEVPVPCDIDMPHPPTYFTELITPEDNFIRKANAYIADVKSMRVYIKSLEQALIYCKQEGWS